MDEDERSVAEETHEERNRQSPDLARPGSDMGTGYAEVVEDEKEDEEHSRPDVGDVYRSGS